MLDRISENQLKILNALAVYKYMTTAQLVRVTGIVHVSNMSINLERLRENKLVDRIASRIGTEDVHFIKNVKAVERLKEHLNIEDIKFPKTKPTLSYQNYFHTMESISCQISLYKSCKDANIEVGFYYRDIDTIGNQRKDKNLKSLTQIKSNYGWDLQPDAIFKLTGDKDRMYVLEYERRDRRSFADLKEKIVKHTTIHNDDNLQKQFDYQRAHRILFVFDDESAMRGTMELARNIGKSTDWIFFKQNTNVFPEMKKNGSTFTWEESNYFEGWLDCTGNKRSIL